MGEWEGSVQRETRPADGCRRKYHLRQAGTSKGIHALLVMVRTAKYAEMANPAAPVAEAADA